MKEKKGKPMSQSNKNYEKQGSMGNKYGKL